MCLREGGKQDGYAEIHRKQGSMKTRLEKATYEPPLVEGHLLKGGNRTVIVREHLRSDIEAPHRFMPKS